MERDLSNDHGHVCCQRRKINDSIRTSSFLRDVAPKGLPMTQKMALHSLTWR